MISAISFPLFIGKSFSHSHCFSQTSVVFWETKRKWATLCVTQTWSQNCKHVWKGFSNFDNNKKEWILLLSVPKIRRRRQWEIFIGVPPLPEGPGGKGNRNQQEKLRDMSISYPLPSCERGDGEQGWEPLLDFPGLWNICLGKEEMFRIGDGSIMGTWGLNLALRFLQRFLQFHRGRGSKVK